VTTEVLLEDLAFPEAPRWHEGELWFSDIHSEAVISVDLAGRARRRLEVPGLPSGLGWLPDGRLLVVSMRDRKLLRLDGSRLVEAADLSRWAPSFLNDMVVGPEGRAFVGHFGYDLFANAEPRPASLLRVEPDGRVEVAAEDLQFPNGSVIFPDGRTLVVAESFAARLTAFTIRDDGTLGDRRIFAELPGTVPDGICLDAEGAIWVASPLSDEVLRVREGGAIAERLHPTRRPYACMLGGPDRRTLFIATADTHDPQQARAKRSGRIEVARTEVPGAGWP
jgi:sugar lactone lactonase YvrE